MALLYADSSALVKLVIDEPESPALRSFIDGADVVSCELIHTEVPRALRRACADDRRLPLDDLLRRAASTLDAVAVDPVDRELLEGAGALAEPRLRALDALHIVSALGFRRLDAFVTYDERQAAAARLAGQRTVAPGA